MVYWSAGASKAQPRHCPVNFSRGETGLKRSLRYICATFESHRRYIGTANRAVDHEVGHSIVPEEIQMKANIRALTLPTSLRRRAYVTAAALALALAAIPSIGHAQGIIGGAERGSREGDRAAGPVGAVVGGAIGAGVGGAV